MHINSPPRFLSMFSGFARKTWPAWFHNWDNLGQAFRYKSFRHTMPLKCLRLCEDSIGSRSNPGSKSFNELINKLIQKH